MPLVETEQIDPLAKKPLELSIEVLIATIEEKQELIRAIIETRGEAYLPIVCNTFNSTSLVQNRSL
jgi:hypothetical protein